MGREQGGWAGEVKHGNLAQLFANPFLRRYTICRKFLSGYHGREDKKSDRYT